MENTKREKPSMMILCLESFSLRVYAVCYVADCLCDDRSGCVFYKAL